MKTSGTVDGHQAGFTLFVVLAFLLLLAAIATPFFSSARSYALVARNVGRASQQRAVAEAILTIAAQRYLELLTPQFAMPDTVKCEVHKTRQSLTISFQDHAGLIDLNKAPAELLRVGFAALGADRLTAEKLAAEVESYRGVADPAGPAEAGSAKSVKSVAEGQEQGPVKSIAELLDFELLPLADPAHLGRIFTVHSRSAQVDPAYVPEVLAPGLGTRLGTRSPSPEQPFGRALTVVAHLAAETGKQISASAIYEFDSNTGLARRSGPVIVETAAGETLENPDRRSLPCDRFMDEGSLAILEELLN